MQSVSVASSTGSLKREVAAPVSDSNAVENAIAVANAVAVTIAIAVANTNASAISNSTPTAVAIS